MNCEGLEVTAKGNYGEEWCLCSVGGVVEIELTRRTDQDEKHCRD
jgi:hypothetical protein